MLLLEIVVTRGRVDEGYLLLLEIVVATRPYKPHSPFPILDQEGESIGLFVIIRDCRSDSPLQTPFPIPYSLFPIP